MDELHEQLKAFILMLENGGETIKGEWTSLQSALEKANSIWDDQFRKDFDDRWAPLQENIASFLNEYPDYLSGLKGMEEALSQYLNQ